jgi:[acyl-carrier-protein] S-malonyltransferase
MSIKCAFLFPGQGSQAVGMGEDLYNNFEIAREILDSASEASNIDFKELLFSENENLAKTEFTQPAILLVSLMAQKVFEQELSLKPTYALGHSLGELSALTSVGALEINDAIKLVNKRGALMAQACEGQDVGMLVSLGLSDEDVESICQAQRDANKQVWAVNYNTDGQIVIAGIKSDLVELEPMLKEAGAKRAMLLNMSVASHCPLLNSAVEPFKEELSKVIKDDFLAPVISNVTAKAYNTKEQTLELLPKQLVMPVLYKQSILNIEPELDCFIEFGHGNVLKGLNKKLTKKAHLNVSNAKTLEATIKALGEM